MKEKVTAVVLAAGKGSRMHSDIQKQYMTLLERPVITYALEAFEDSSVDEVILVVAPGEVEYAQKNILDKYSYKKVKKIVTGGGNPFDIYPLGNGLHFDSANRRLFRKEKAEFITRQASTLLLAFLKAENCNLSISEICDVAGWWWYFRTGIYCCQKAACLFGGDVRRCSHSKWRLPLSAENPGFIGGKRENT